MRIMKQGASVFLIFVLMTGCDQQQTTQTAQIEPVMQNVSVSPAPSLEPSAPAQPLSQGLELMPAVLGSLKADLYGDGNQEEIALILYADNNSNPYLWQIKVDGNVKATLAQAGDGVYGPPAELKIEDINGDGKPELLVYRYNTGTGGGIGLTIYSPWQGWEPIFAVENPFAAASMSLSKRYHVQYEGNYKVSFQDKAMDLEAIIPLDPHKYESIQLPLDQIGTWVDPISLISFQEQEGVAGRKQITTEQRVIGVSHPDTLAILRTTYQWNGASYIPVEIGLYGEQGEPIKRKPFKLSK